MVKYLDKTVQFAIKDVKRFRDDEDPEFAVARVEFLSTRPNSHEMVITEDVLREYAISVIGKPLIGKMNILNTDVKGHEVEENIFGWAPANQEVEFREDEDGYIVAGVDFVVSKLYATHFYDLFDEDDNYRSVSVEMLVGFKQDEDGNDTNIVENLHITGVTVLGKKINPSVPNANIQFVQFSESKAKDYYNNLWDRITMAEKKTYKIDKSKEAMSEDPWGDVDKAAMRDKIMEAKNRATLVKSVYLLVEEGWEDAPSEHLKYPVMQLKDDTFVYNRGALASAKAYAEQHDEQEVLDKLEKIYDKLDLNKEEEEEKMAEVKMSAVNLGELWGKIYDKMDDKDHWQYCIEGIYEEDGQKFVILYDRENYYRVDFTFTEEGDVELAETKVEVEKAFLENGEVTKFSEPEGVDLTLYKTIMEEPQPEAEAEEPQVEPEEVEETQPEVSEEIGAPEEVEELAERCEDDMDDDMDDEDDDCEKCGCGSKEKMKELEAQLQEKEDIITKYEAELEELRAFKAEKLEAEKIGRVNTLLAQIKGKIDEADYEKFEKQSTEITFEEVDAWKNNILAQFAEQILNNEEVVNSEDITRMEVPNEEINKKATLWDRIG